MSETTTPAAKPGFFRQLVTGTDGTADEAAVAFLLGVVAIVALKTYATICPSHPFDAAEFSAGYAGMLSFYNASKGVMKRLGSDRQ